jgi:hypothetical protein
VTSSPSSAETLSKASSDPRVLWQLANNALSKAPASLPPALVNAAGNMTSGKPGAAETINAYFIGKVDSLCATSESSTATSDAVHPAMDASDSGVDIADKATEVADQATEVADKAREAADKGTDVPDPARESAKPKGRSFKFTFENAGKIAKIIRGLKATEAMGIDDIPTSVLKKGVEVLAGPISHLVNCSLAEGRVP